MTLRHHTLVQLLVVALSYAAASAQAPWTITTADFKTVNAAGLTLDEGGATTAGEQGGEPRRVPWDQFLLAERADAAVAPAAVAAPFVLYLASGDQLAGEPTGVVDEAVRWKTAAAGEVNVSLRQVRALTKTGQSVRFDQAAQTEDAVLLANGDSVRGIVTDVTSDAVTVTPAGMDPVPVPLESITAILFAATGGGGEGPAADARSFRVRLTDGSALTGTELRLNDKELTMKLGGGESRTLPADTVAAVEQLNGPVTWLSALPPGENVHTPFLETAWPARMDRTVTGEPIRVDGRTVSRGIGVHSRSQLTWPLDGSYQAFRTQYAVDGDLPYANVTVRIKLDDKVVHEQKDVVAGPAAPVVQVPLEGARSLTLEVDYGQTYDVQDRFVWIEPALLRAAPARTD